MHKDTPRRLRYASGYTELNMLTEASDELESIAFEDRLSLPVLTVRLTFHMAAKHWDAVIGIARAIAREEPKNEQGWICWAYALRELQRVEEARAVLLEAEPLHGEKCAVLHYNLGCYYCLLGETEKALQRLHRAYKMHPPFKADAVYDPDLARLFGEVA